MDTLQILCCLRYVSSFLGVFPSDLLPQHPIACSGTLIVNTDPHRVVRTGWPFIFNPDPTLTTSIATACFHLFHPHNHTPQLHRVGQPYSCKDLLVPSVACTALFALYMDRGYTP